ncbi:D site-binding protein-like [Sitophilus oryzae]|uniref:D site-binding protein-like n=1 Tax=Sitophilus oryzae TaxID=7048 RepID=A0A6J2YNM9_SITOR|nr:D site-binding protein-like [Sitophilus oryzae]
MVPVKTSACVDIMSMKMEVLDLSVRKHSQAPIRNACSPGYMDYHMYPNNASLMSWQYYHQSLQRFGEPCHTLAQPSVSPGTVLRPSPVNSGTSAECDLPERSPDSSLASSSDLERSSRGNLAIKRPFKLISSITKNAAPLLTSIDTDENTTYEYEQFRKKVLSQYDSKQKNESNKNMRRTIATNAERSKDPEYVAKRRKNNEAAKRSREARKAREDELAIRVAYLEQENMKLRWRLALVEKEKKLYTRQIECV